MQIFWMVWNVEGRAPTVQHASKDAARTEAERLAKKNPGQRFAVLQAIGECETVKPVQWSEPERLLLGEHVNGCVCDDCIPF